MKKPKRKFHCEKCGELTIVKKVAIIGALEMLLSECPNGHQETRYRLLDIG